MKISLLTPTPPDISAFGIRALSSFLKNAGHQVQLIFLPGGIDLLKHGGEYQYRYSTHALDQILNVLSGSQVIGFSFMSQYRDRAIQLTKAVRNAMSTFIIWGGIHPEVCPEEALKYADGVCMTEGETVLLELVNTLDKHQDTSKIPGLWTLRNGKAVHTEYPALISDLDTLPFCDFGLTDHYLLNPVTDHLEPMSMELLRRTMPLMPALGGGALTVYRIMTSRGCPHRCTYCANRIKAERHPSETYLRFRSPDHVLSELQTVTADYPFIEGIHFFDDVFTAMKPKDLENLCHQYKETIDLPYYAQISPAIFSKTQLELFLDTGLVFLEMGIQTGSPSIRSRYCRPETNENILNAATLLHEHRTKLVTPHYHVILDNPWESRNDVRQTLNLLTQVPGKFKLCLASLTFYPGTDLYYQALKEGIIKDEEKDIYRKPFYIPKGRYLNYLIYLTDIIWIPRSFLRWMGNVPSIFLDRPFFGAIFDIARRVTDNLRLLAKGLGALFKGEFKRISAYFRRVR